MLRSHTLLFPELTASTMAAPARCLRQVSSTLLQQARPAVARPSIRAFTTHIAQHNHLVAPRTPYWLQTRKVSRSTRRHAAVQEAPRPEAYLESGIIEAGKNLVDVKKVLVIGSGGLSIGQAGEFDYSGTLHTFSVHDSDLRTMQDHKLSRLSRKPTFVLSS